MLNCNVTELIVDLIGNLNRRTIKKSTRPHVSLKWAASIGPTLILNLCTYNLYLYNLNAFQNSLDVGRGIGKGKPEMRKKTEESQAREP